MTLPLKTVEMKMFTWQFFILKMFFLVGKKEEESVYSFQAFLYGHGQRSGNTEQQPLSRINQNHK